MLITRSTCSHGPSGNREADRFGQGNLSGRREEASWMTKVRALAKANPLWASSRKSRVANLPEVVKPETDWEETSGCTNRARRGSQGRRVPKDSSRNRGEPVGCSEGTRFPESNRDWESITSPGPGGKSEGLIVAKKRGNARGAKEPCHGNEEIEKKGELLEWKSLH